MSVNGSIKTPLIDLYELGERVRTCLILENLAAPMIPLLEIEGRVLEAYGVEEDDS